MTLTKHNRMTVADLRALKGKRQLTMLFVDTLDEAAADAAARVDMLSIIEPVWSPAMREAAGDCFVQVGLIYGQHCTYEDYLRAAHAGIITGGDAFYCAGSLDTIGKLAAEGIPVVGHVGLIPARPGPAASRRSARRRRRRSPSLSTSRRSRPPARLAPRSRSCPRARRRNLEAHLAHSAVDGRRRRGRLRNISSPRTCSAIRAAISLASQGLPQLPRRNRPLAARARSRPSRSSAPTSRTGAYPEDKHMVPIADAEFEAFMTALER